MEIQHLILYQQEKDSLFARFGSLLLTAKSQPDKVSEDEFYQCMQELVAFNAKHGMKGNVWHCYLTYLMVYHENPYSIDCEMVGYAGGTMDEIAKGDFALLKQLFDIDLCIIEELFSISMGQYIEFSDGNAKDKVFNRRIRDCICELSKTLEGTSCVEDFQAAVSEFYKRFGVGTLGLHKAFRLDDTGNIIPITKIAHVTLDDLIGYDMQKKKLKDNTNAFVAGRKANNCLLFGDAGTGKSTSIKALANQYYDDGLRIIEVYKHQFQYLNALISVIKNRNYKFIIYMDDLSFEEFEVEYKYLKAVIEGGLEKKPDNILIYATSNRRHLVRESFKDKADADELHKNDTVQEKLSLYARFGVTIYYGSPSPKEFKEIVLQLKERNHIRMAEDEILLLANQWELNHGGLSGRTAQQFIDYLLGMKEDET